jgi:hypothetical protein
MRPLHRLAPALLLLPILGSACNPTAETFPCPYGPVASLAFSGTRTLVSCAGGAPAAGIDSLYPELVSFTGTLTSSASGSVAALCLGRTRAEPLLGTRLADQFDVALETRGALLAGCNNLCAVTVRQQVTGTLQRGPGGDPIGFTGTLVDQATLDGAVSSADCSPCITPCQASYALSGLPQ